MANVYNRGKLIMTDGTLGATGWATGGADIGVLLCTTTYVYNADHDFVDDITNELSGGGYARQTAIGGRTITEDLAADHIEYDATDVTFAALDIAAGQPTQAIIYNNTPATDATRQLIARVVLTTPPVPNGGDYIIQWDADGVMTLGE